MSKSNDEPGKPNLDPQKAPYGHADEPPLASVFPEKDETPVVRASGEGVHGTADAPFSSAAQDMPVFPPKNVGFVSPEDASPLPAARNESAETDEVGEAVEAREDTGENNDEHQQDEGASALVKARPFASIVLAALFGVALVGVLIAGRRSRRA